MGIDRMDGMLVNEPKVKMPCKLYCETHLAGEERWFLSSEPDLMQINLDVPECVAFIGYKKKLAGGATEIIAGGTVFFVHVTLQAGLVAVYAITARHVIEEIKRRAIDDRAHIRLSRPAGPIWVDIRLSEWVFSEDNSVDVAVVPITGDVLSENRTIPETMFATSEIISNERIRIGHELFFPGLFVHHIGEKANLPIVRWGAIAAMPNERIATEWGTVKGYLVEARSIGGLSGSPVFVQAGPYRQVGEHEVQLGNIFYYLLGLVHGHYDESDSADSTGDVFPHDAFSKSVNMGIAVVVPAIDIAATLAQDGLVKQRSAIVASAKARRRLPKTD